MKWGNPSALLFLILPLIVGALILWDLRRGVQAFSAVVSRELWGRMLPGWNPRARDSKVILWSTALVFLLLAAARPQWGFKEETVSSNGLDLMIVLDLSRSMDVEDVVPSRIQKARHMIRGLLGRLGGDRVGVVAFAAGSYVASPLTNDLRYVQEVVDVLSPATFSNQGTDIGLGLETAISSLERGSEADDRTEGEKQFPTRAMLLITDGEDQEGQAAQMAAKLKERSIRVFVIGVGSRQGGPIPMRDEQGNLQGYKRKNSEAVVSKLDPTTLEKIAQESGGRYWSATDSEEEIEAFLKELGALDRSQLAEHKVQLPQERFQYFVLMGVLLLLVEAWIPLSRVAVLLVTFGLLSFALLPGTNAHASNLQSYLRNREGLKAYGQKDMETAKKKFSEAQQMEPGQVEPIYNQGIAQLGQGDAEGALKSFEGASRQSNLNGDPGMAGMSLYNLGSAQEKSRQLGPAIRSFAEAIRMAQLSGDAALELDARKRILKLQEEKQKQDQDQNQNKDQKKDQDQNQKQDQNQNQKNDDKKDSPKDNKGEEQDQKQKKFEDPSVSRRREFKSEKLTPEDSERVMAELSEREKNLQARLKKQRGARSANNGKDW